MTIKFDLPKNSSSIIKVIGVGGGGSNAVTHMYNLGIRGVDFIVSNTDRQALEISPVPNKVQLGTNLTDGMGAGSIPDIGRQAAIESIEEIKELLKTNTKMVFITAGMGGGTGTGAAPVLASVAKELGILTVGIVTIPFSFEGRKRKMQADQGIEEMRKYVDTLLIICNDKLRTLHGDLKLSEAFSRADDILTIAAKGIAEIITVTGYINVDFNDVNTVMRNSGVAIMGTGVSEGENRAIKAVEMAMSSPLLNDNDITGAQNILLYIASGNEEISMDEVSEITEYIQQAAGSTAEIIWGNGNDDTLGNQISVTLIATGFNAGADPGYPGFVADSNRTVVPLDKAEEKKPEPVSDDEIRLVTREIAREEIKPPVVTDTRPVSQPATEEKKVVYPLDGEPQAKTVKQTAEPAAESFNQPVFSDFAQINDAYTRYSQPDRQPEPQRLAEEEDLLQARNRERVNRLKEMSVKLKNPEGLNQIEKEPAYVRRNISLISNTSSSESEISKYSMGDENGPSTDLKPNSFLHDNVD